MSLPRMADLVQVHTDMSLAATFYLAGLRKDSSGSGGLYTSDYAIVVADWAGTVYAMNGWNAAQDAQRSGFPLASSVTKSPMKDEDQTVALDILNALWDDTELGRMLRYQPTFEATAAKTLVNEAFDYPTLSDLGARVERGDGELVAAYPLDGALFANHLAEEAQLVVNARSTFPGMNRTRWMKSPLKVDESLLDSRLAVCGALPSTW